jgi:peptide chain release factor 2
MNKETALKLLKSKLLAIAQEQKAREIKDIKGDLVTADFGSQVSNR